MKSTRLALGFVLGSAVAGAAGLTAQVVPLGPEVDLRANTWPNLPFAASQPDGSYVVAWDEGYGSRDGIFYRFVAAGSSPDEEEWPATFASSEESYPSVEAVTATPRGFDLLWHEPVDGAPRTFYRLHLNLRGVPEGKPVRLGGSGTEWVWLVRGNGFMAGWTLPARHAIAAQRLDSSGQRTGKELRLSSRPVDDPRPVVLGLADGGFLAVWIGVTPGPAANLVLRARRFSSKGKPLGPDFDVNSIPLGPAGLYYPEFQVAAAPGGGFAVAWMESGQPDDTIQLRLFDAGARALGPQIPAVAEPHEEDYAPEPQSIAFDKAGNLLLLWMQWLDDVDLRLQPFDPHGTPLGASVGVRSAASDIFEAPWGGSVVWSGSSWLVAWGAAGMPAGDFSTVFVRRFGLKK
jgi:hypothetical protein